MMENWQVWQARLGQADVLNISVLTLLSAGLAFLVALLTLYLVKIIGARRVARFAEQTRTGWDDAVLESVQRTKLWFMIIVALFCASLFLGLDEKSREITETVTILALLVQAAFWGNVLIQSGLERYARKRVDVDPGVATSVSAIAFIGKLILFSVLVLLALDNLGMDVTTLVAGLGVGGVAVALAVQNILGDLFASLTIVLDKPFVQGDFIVVGDEVGNVEKVGLKTTRVRSLSGEQLIFSNNDLLQSRIRNFQRMFERRQVFAVGVTYQTPLAKLREIPQAIREIVESQEQVRFDRAHFKDFGDFSLNFEVVYYTLVPDYSVYMDVQQAINLAIFERFEEMEVEFAYPTQTLFLEKLAAQQENGPGRSN